MNVDALKMRLVQLETENTIMRNQLTLYHFLVKWLHTVCSWFFSYSVFYTKNKENFSKELIRQELLMYPVKVTKYIEKYTEEFSVAIYSIIGTNTVRLPDFDIPKIELDNDSINLINTYFVETFYKQQREKEYDWVASLSAQEQVEWNAFLGVKYPGFNIKHFLFDVELHMLNMDMARDFFLKIGAGSFDLFFDGRHSIDEIKADLKIAFNSLKATVLTYWKDNAKIVVDDLQFTLSNKAISKLTTTNNLVNTQQQKMIFYRDNIPTLTQKAQVPSRYFAYPVETLNTVNMWLQLLTGRNMTVATNTASTAKTTLDDIFEECGDGKVFGSPYDLLNYQVKNICLVENTQLFIDKIATNICYENFLLKSILRIIVRSIFNSQDLNQKFYNVIHPLVNLAKMLGERVHH